MHKLKLQRISLAVLCALPARGAARRRGSSSSRSRTLLLLPPPPSEDELPVFLEADTLRGHAENEIEAEGNVAAAQARAARCSPTGCATTSRPTRSTRRGNVRIDRGADVMEGDAAAATTWRPSAASWTTRATRCNKELEPQPATVQRKPFEPTSARGTAERLLFEGPEQYRAERAEYTTCGPGDDDWYIRAARAARSTRTATSAPRATRPSCSSARRSSIRRTSRSPLHQERKSGFLTPHYGSTSKGGVELTVPYYWNIAPNRDATISPRVMTQARRAGAAASSATSSPSYQRRSPRRGPARRPQFRTASSARAISSRTRHTLPARLDRAQAQPAPGLGRHLLHRPLDADRGDLAGPAAERRHARAAAAPGAATGIVRVQRLRPALADAAGRSARAGHAALQPAAADHVHRARAPSVLRYRLRFLQAQYVAFDHPTLVTGSRAPRLSEPEPAAADARTPTSRPRSGVHLTRYFIDPNTAGFQRPDRARCPIFTVDSGVVFERQTHVRRHADPADARAAALLRLHPVPRPERHPELRQRPAGHQLRDDLLREPVRGLGPHQRRQPAHDRRHLALHRAPTTGAERLRAGIAQRYYFEHAAGHPARRAARARARSSDLLAALSGRGLRRTGPRTRACSTAPISRRLQKFNVGARYQPAPGQGAQR